MTTAAWAWDIKDKVPTASSGLLVDGVTMNGHHVPSL